MKRWFLDINVVIYIDIDVEKVLLYFMFFCCKNEGKGFKRNNIYK